MFLKWFFAIRACFVVVVLGILALIGVPRFQSLIKQAIYIAAQWSLMDSRDSCFVSGSTSLPVNLLERDSQVRIPPQCATEVSPHFLMVVVRSR